MENELQIEKTFDLNIEKILENWEVCHAIREIIANALDEQSLTGTVDICIEKVNGQWHIIDYGRGLSYKHLTQNENDEKLQNDKLIGKFGFGLKDALATLYRNNVRVEISSKYGYITLTKAAKVGFDDIITLQAKIDAPKNDNMVGTDFCLTNCMDEDMEKAKSMFLIFSGAHVLEKTEYGDILEKQGDTADIYINGIKVASEDNFLFSYNITSLNKKIKKALNRERSNVGRVAYTDRIKDIVKSCESEKVMKLLIKDFYSLAYGKTHDELGWQDTQMFVAERVSHYNDNVTFVTARDMEYNPDIIDEMKMSGKNPVYIPGNIAVKMNEINDSDNSFRHFVTVEEFRKEEQERFNPVIIGDEALTESEKAVYRNIDKILALIGGQPKAVKNIYVADKLYSVENGYETLGLWQPEKGEILIKRNQLVSVECFAGTLLHECAHAVSNESDVSRGFELKLTHFLGKLANKLIMGT